MADTTPTTTAPTTPKVKTLVGVITLKSGERLEFTDYISYFAARAFYSIRGAILLAVHSTWGQPRQATPWNEAVPVAEPAPLAKAA